MSTTPILFEGRVAFGALVHIEIDSVRVLIYLVILILQTSSARVVDLLALHTNVLVTARTIHQFLVGCLIDIKNLIAIWSRTKEQIFSRSHELIILKSFVLLEAVLRNDALDLLFGRILIAVVLRALESGMLILIFYHGPKSLGEAF